MHHHVIYLKGCAIPREESSAEKALLTWMVHGFASEGFVLVVVEPTLPASRPFSTQPPSAIFRSTLAAPLRILFPKGSDLNKKRIHSITLRNSVIGKYQGYDFQKSISSQVNLNASCHETYLQISLVTEHVPQSSES